MTSATMHLLILTIALFIFSSNTSIAEQRFPTLWFEAPSSIAGYPLSGNCSSSQTINNSDCRIIDPWLYLDRLGLYKILINATTPYMDRFCSVQPLQECNILFGLAANFGWQFDSNRLFSNGTKNISVNSWWASFNYYLSVIPFLAAVDTGVIRSGAFQIVQRDIFCSNSDECLKQIPSAMIHWRNYFLNLLQSRSCSGVTAKDGGLIDECYLGPMWLAHNASVANALPIIKTKLSLLPSYNEQHFSLAWSNVLYYIAIARKNSNLIETNIYQDKYLPGRMLTDKDNPPYCPDLSKSVNLALELLHDIPLEFYSEFMDYWYGASTCYESGIYAQIALEIAPLSRTLAAAYYEIAQLTVLVC
ncbi:unnamed protein product [Adineta steineri]|uniref:Uncharacterized protein n=1 Tax=Adineta steineri TaxID=433720 RepID=A0A814JAH1_9BILA|nr:unnamed protein product [Adineta steineri]CAF1077559.1 unnamed protein product [Adineta steineri]